MRKRTYQNCSDKQPSLIHLVSLLKVNKSADRATMAPAGRLNKLQNLDKVALQRAWTVPLLATKALLLQYTRAQTQYALLTWRQGQARREHWYPSLHPFVIVRKLYSGHYFMRMRKRKARVTHRSVLLLQFHSNIIEDTICHSWAAG